MRAIIFIIFTLVPFCLFAQNPGKFAQAAQKKIEQQQQQLKAETGTTTKTLIKAGEKTKTAPESTNFEYQDREGNIYPVYKGAKGGYFINRISKKTNKEYRQYIKVNN